MQGGVIRQLERRYGAYAFGLIAALLLLAAVRPTAELAANLREAALANERAASHLQIAAGAFERIAPWISLHQKQQTTEAQQGDREQ